MTSGWKQFAGRCKQGGLALLWAFIYDPITARIVNFYRHPRLWRRRLLRTTILVGLVLVVFVLVIPGLAHAGVGKWAALAVGYILSIIVGLLSSILSLLGWIFNGVVYNWEWFQKIVTFPAVEEGWTAVRDVANLSFVLILLGIGFATILRVPTYHIKRLILPFVVALLLINFSKLICGVVLDFCRVLMASFAQSMVENSSGGNYSGVIAKAIGVESFFSPPEAVEDTSQAVAYLQSVIAVFLFMIALCFAFLMLIALLISRWVSLMVLTIFSPLAYAGMILPSTQKMVKSWWTSFMQKAFYGPAAVFMVWLAMSVLMTMAVQRDQITVGGEKSDFSIATISNNIRIGADTFLILLIAVIILLKAVTISKSMGIAGANGVINAGSGLAKQAGKGAWRGTKSFMKGAAGAMGFRNVGDRVAGLRNKLWRGQQDAENARRAKNEKGVSGSMAGRDEAQQKAIMAGSGKGARGGASAAERVEAATQLMKDGKLSDKEMAEAEKVVNRYGSRQKQAEFKDLYKANNIGKAESDPLKQADYIKRKGVDTQSDESLKGNAKVIMNNASRGQVDKLNKQQKAAYADGLKSVAADPASNIADKEKAQREYARMTGGFDGLGIGVSAQQKALENMNARDVAQLNSSQINPIALRNRVQGNLDDLAVINTENPQMAKEQRDLALARVASIEAAGTPAAGSQDEKFLQDAYRVFGRPTTP